MILTPENLAEISATCERKRATGSVVLPDWAYGKNGRCVVQVDGVSIDLHRHLHNLLIRPLAHHEIMVNDGEPRNINPWMFHVKQDRRSDATHCHKGHAYEGNEAPPNSRGYRCLTCLKDSTSGGGTPNALKTHCPANHEYTAENTLVGKDGKRRCLTCTRARKAAYMRRKRKESQ